MYPHPIAFCITSLEPGGAEQQLVQLAVRLPPEAFHPRLFVLAPPPSAPHDGLVVQLRQANVPVTFLGARRPRHSVRTLHRLARQLRRVRPALLQCFLAHANVLGALAARYTGVPCMLSGIRVAEQRRNGHRWLAHATDPFVTRHVCVSQSVADFAKRQMRLPPDKIVVIPNGVDVQRYSSARPATGQQLGLPPGRRFLLYAGRLDRQKRVGWLLRRMAEIAPRLPNHDLVLAGDGPHRRHLEALAARLSIAGRVHFLGWRPDVPNLMAAADSLLLASAWEGMPNVLLEAMAAGRPVVVTQVQGAEQVLGSLAAQQMVPPSDSSAFVQRAIHLAQTPLFADELGRRNQNRVVAHFSVEAMVNQYGALYEKFLSSENYFGGPFLGNERQTSNPRNQIGRRC